MTITINDYLQCLTYFIMFAVADFVLTSMFIEQRLGIDNIYLFILLLVGVAICVFILSCILFMDISAYAEEEDA